MTEEGGDSNDIRSTYDEIDEEDEATRHARRIYFGELSPTANEQSVATYFSHVISAIVGNTAGPGDAVVNVYINHEKCLYGARVKVRRPSDYNPSLAATLGPSQPNPNLNLGVVGLTPGGLEGPDRIFVGGLPYYFTKAQVRELLESFVALRGFDLVKDRETGNSKVLLTEEELVNDEDYEDIMEDMKIECGKFSKEVKELKTASMRLVSQLAQSQTSAGYFKNALLWMPSPLRQKLQVVIFLYYSTSLNNPCFCNTRSDFNPPFATEMPLQTEETKRQILPPLAAVSDDSNDDNEEDEEEDDCDTF
ncbi:splicing factor U2af large subunit B-like protein isoform X3 [Tanacetum coccineum]